MCTVNDCLVIHMCVLVCLRVYEVSYNAVTVTED